MNEEKARW
jgi:aldehyde dehydrogenase family 7 protein A1